MDRFVGQNGKGGNALADAASDGEDRASAHHGGACDLAAKLAGVITGFPAEMAFGI